MAEKSSQKVAEKSSHSGYARTPREVLLDKDLSHSATRVYARIALDVKQGTTAKLGQRLIAKDLGMDRSTVAAALAELQAQGHLVIVGTGQRRRVYHLKSAVFGQKQGCVTEVVSSPSGGKRYASITKGEVA